MIIRNRKYDGLVLLINNKGNNTNLEKIKEVCGKTSDAIENQLLESFVTG